MQTTCRQRRGEVDCIIVVVAAVSNLSAVVVVHVIRDGGQRQLGSCVVRTVGDVADPPVLDARQSPRPRTRRAPDQRFGVGLLHPVDGRQLETGTSGHCRHTRLVRLRLVKTKFPSR